MEFAWPKKGHRLFKVADDHEPVLTAWNGLHMSNPAEAFKEAADSVLRQAETESKDFRLRHPEMILPVCYLYRHSIELRLKDIVRAGVKLRFFEQHKVEECLAGHSLATLWTKAKALICEVWKEEEPSPVKVVESVINEFHQLDRSGQTFRYARDKKGKPHDYGPIAMRVSSQNLRQTMDAVFNFIDGCHSGLVDICSDMDQCY